MRKGNHSRKIAASRERFQMRLLYSLIPALALFSSHQAIAQGSYPDRPIKMIVPLAAASAVDVAARIVTQKMADNMGQQIVIPEPAGRVRADRGGGRRPRRTGRLHDRRVQ